MQTVDGSISYWEWFTVSDRLVSDDAWHALFRDTQKGKILTMSDKMELVHQSDRHELIKQYATIRDGECADISVEFRMRVKPGRFIRISEQVHVVERTRQGKPSRIAGMCRVMEMHGLQCTDDANPQLNFLQELTDSFGLPCLLARADSAIPECWNKECLQLFGFTKTRMAKATLFDLSAEPVRLKKYLNSKEHHIPLHYIRTGNDQILPVEMTVSSCRWSGHHFWLILFSDLSKRKQHEKQLQHSVDELRNTVSSLGDLVLTSDMEGNITGHFETNCELSGAYQSLATSGHIFKGQARKKFLHGVMKLRESGKMQQIEIHVRKNGDWWFEVRLNPRRDEFNQFTGITLVVRDLSAKKKQRNMFSEEDVHFAEMADLLPLPMAEFDPQGQIRHLNAPAMKLIGLARYKYKTDHLNLAEIISAEDLKRFLLLEELIKAGSSLRVLHFQLLRHDGSRIPVDCHFDIRLQNNQLKAYRVLMISTLHQASIHKELAALQERQIDYFQQRFSSFSSISALLSDKTGTLSSREGMIQQELSRMTRALISSTRKDTGEIETGKYLDLLSDLAALEAGDYTPVYAPLPAGDLLEKLSAILQTGDGKSINRMPVENMVSVVDSEVSVLADRKILFRLMDELYAGCTQSGRLRNCAFEMKPVKNGLAIRCHGKQLEGNQPGCELHPEGLSSIEPPGKTGNNPAGYVRYQMIQSWCEAIGASLSRHPMGCELVLPAARMQEAEALLKTGNGIFAGRNILLLDQDVGHSKYLRTILQDTGVRLWEVQTARQAIYYCLHQQLPDLLIMDPILPDMDAIAVLKTMHKQAAAIPVIIHTSLAGNEDREKYETAGFFALLIKPYTGSELLRVLEEAFSVQPALTRLHSGGKNAQRKGN